jgi:hypothetical protein
VPSNPGNVGELWYMSKAYVDDFCTLAIPTSREDLTHVVNVVMTGVHDVFPADKDDANDPLSPKNMQKKKSMWVLHKDIFGFTFDWVE